MSNGIGIGSAAAAVGAALGGLYKDLPNSDDNSNATDAAGAAQDSSATPPKTPEDLKTLFPELKDATPEKLQAVFDAIQQVASGDISEKLKGLGTLAGAFPDTLSTVLEKLGIKDNKIVKLASDKDVLNSLATLSNPEASNMDKAKAALQLGSSICKVFDAKEASELLKSALGAAGLSSELADAIAVWSDPNASGVEKGKATLSLANELKSFVGDQFPQLAGDLRLLDGSLKAVGAALTLMDPNASTSDKLLAAAQLATEIPDIGKDLQTFADHMRQIGVPGATVDSIVQNLQNFDDVAGKVGAENLKKMVGSLAGNPDALSSLMSQLSTMDAADAKRLMGTLETLRPDVLTDVLGDDELLKNLANTAKNLDDDAAKTLGKVVSNMDADMLRSLTKLTGGASPEVLKAAIKGLAPLLENVDGKVIGEVLKAFDKTISKMGIAITGDLVEKVFKNLLKIVPAVGAAPSVADAARYAQLSDEFKNKNKDLAAFAAVGARLNGGDAAVDIVTDVLDATGVGAAAGLPVDIVAGAGFAGAELAVDILFEQEKEKFNADPQGYQAPDWMKAVNLVGNDPLTLITIYGPTGAQDLAQWGAGKFADAASAVTKAVGTGAAEAVGDGLEVTAGMIDQAADVLEHPEQYGQAALDSARKILNSTIKAGGALAEKAKEVVGNVIAKAKELGEQGLETLKFFAQNPDELGKLAVKGIEDMVTKAMEAGDKVYQLGIAALGEIEDAWGKVTDVAAEALDKLKDTTGAIVDKALALGEQGLDALAWVAANPGEAMERARQELGNLLAKGGEMAEKAWDAIKGLGSKGLDLAEKAIDGLKDAGVAAFDTLRYIAQNPGEAAEKVGAWVGKALDSTIRAGGDMARKAAETLRDLVEDGAKWAVDFAAKLIVDGKDVFTNVLGAWKDNVLPGVKDVAKALGHLGQAGQDALVKLGGAIGGQFAKAAGEVCGDLRDAGEWAAEKALDAGGAVVDVVENTIDWLTPDFLNAPWDHHA